MTRPLRTYRLFFCVWLCLLWLTSSCGPKPTPTPVPTPTVPPPALRVAVNPPEAANRIYAGDTVGVSAEVEGPFDSISGEAGRGQLTRATAASFFYTAPATAGPDTVTITVKGPGGQTTQSAHFNVVPRPTETRPPPTATPVVTPSATATATRVPTATSVPTATAVPIAVSITAPIGDVNCLGAAACQFTVEGVSSGVGTNPDLRIYVFVFPFVPPGSGWYPQISPATVSLDGTWVQTPAYIGNIQAPARPGDTLRIVAVVQHKQATWNGTPPSQWQGGSLDSYLDVVPAPLAVSNIVTLRVQ